MCFGSLVSTVRICSFQVASNSTPRNLIGAFNLPYNNVSCTNKRRHENLERLIEDFENLCNWVLDSTLTIHFGENKKK